MNAAQGSSARETAGRADETSSRPGSPGPDDRRPPGGRTALDWPRLLVWLPVVLLPMLVGALWAADPPFSFIAPNLSLALSFVFSSLSSAFVAYLVASSFLVRGTPGLLLLGCGVVAWGLASVVPFAGTGRDPNLQITIHNTCALISALCHLVGAIASLRARGAIRHTALWLPTSFLAVFGAIALVGISAFAGWLPVFFVEGSGGTPVRQLVLASSIGMFGLTAGLLWALNRRGASPFLFWYSPALALVAVGLLAVMMQSTYGGILNWTGRATQYLSGVYMVMAALAAARESRASGISLEAALHASEQRFQAIFEQSPLGIALADANGRIVESNPAMQELVGYTREELNNLSFAALTHPDDLKAEWELIKQSLEGSRTQYELEKRYIRKDGEVRWVRLANRILHSGPGEPQTAIAVVQDISDRKRLELALRKSEEQARLALQAGKMAAWDQSLPDGSTTWNDEHFRMLGYLPGEVQPGYDAWAARVHPEDFPEAAARFERSLTAGGEFTSEFRVVWPDGSIHWVEARGRTESTSEGKPTRAYGVMMDVTERKQAEAALRESERRYRAIGESINYGVWVCAPDGRNIYASPSFLDLVGMTQQQCSDFGWGNVLHPDDAERTLAAWKECVQTGGTWDIEHRYHGVDGQWHTILARGVPVRDEQGQITCWAGINLDITRLKKTQEDLQEARVRLEAHAGELERTVASRTARLRETVAELEHFSYAIAHDLRAPLRAMQGFAALLEEHPGCNADDCTKDYLSRIRIAANRMDRLITDTLNYSKAVRHEMALAPVDLNCLIRELTRTYPNLQPDKVDIRIDAVLPVVSGNEAALSQCFSNLLGNAVKFAKPGTRPNVRIQPESRQDREVRIWIEDDGIGIPEDALERIFGLFERVDASHEGTGMGLAIVKKVVERMCGKVGVESELGKGSRFWVDLPLATNGSRTGDSHMTPKSSEVSRVEGV